MNAARKEFEEKIDALILSASGRELDCARDSFRLACEIQHPHKGSIVVVASSGSGSIGFLCRREDLQKMGEGIMEFDPAMREKDTACSVLAVAIEKGMEDPDSHRLTRSVGPLAWNVLQHHSPAVDDGIIIFAHVVLHLDKQNRTVVFLSLVPKP